MRNVKNYGNFPGRKAAAELSRCINDQSTMIMCGKGNKLNLRCKILVIEAKKVPASLSAAKYLWVGRNKVLESHGKRKE